MKRDTNVITAGLLALVMVSTSAGQIGGGSFTNPVSGGGSFTNPASSGGYSATTPGSTYQNSLVPNMRGVYDYSRNRVVGGTFGGTRRYLNTISASDSFIRRSATSPYLYDGDPSRIESYSLRRRRARLVMRGVGSGLTARETAYRSGRSKYAAKPKPADTLGIYQRRSTLSMSVEELDRLSGRSALRSAMELPVDKLLTNTVSVRKREDFYKKAMRGEEVKRLERLIDNTLEQMAPVKPIEPEMSLTVETKELKELLDREQKVRKEVRDKGVKPVALDEMEGLEVEAEEAEATDRAESKYGLKLPERLEIPVANSVKARGILGEHKDFESLARAKFDGFMEEGDGLLKEGKFYKAIHAYVLASVWNNSSAEANLHRGIAHFAAGEYMSGSLFVRRAMVLSPEYTANRMDIAGLIADRDVIENRIIEAVEWQGRGDSGELAFLLAYVYYQEGKLSQARKYMEMAGERLLEDEAVGLLKKAIGGDM